jgi:hypothetical protein
MVPALEPANAHPHIVRKQQPVAVPHLALRYPKSGYMPGLSDQCTPEARASCHDARNVTRHTAMNAFRPGNKQTHSSCCCWVPSNSPDQPTEDQQPLGCWGLLQHQPVPRCAASAHAHLHNHSLHHACICAPLRVLARYSACMTLPAELHQGTSCSCT